MEILGHRKQWEVLKKSAETGKISHAYLFAGQDKLGKRKVALEWISLLFKKDIQKGQHPDLILIEPTEREIQIGQIRDLIWKLSLKPYSAPLKAAIINEAHSMNQEAQTCLLKTLEEPRGQTLLILISDRAQYLFPTILSRVQTLKFYPVKKEEIKNYLQKQGILEKEAEEISKVSLGKPGVAMDYISDPKKLANFQEKIKELNKISNSELVTRFQYAKNLSQNPQELKEILDIWLNYFREIMLSRIQQGGRDLARLKNILNRIQTTKFLISTTNVNPRLTLEILMLEL